MSVKEGDIVSKDFWGIGIPHYSNNDLMTAQEIYEFAIESTIPFMKKEGYEFIDITKNMSSFPSLVLKKEGILYFVLVKTEIAIKQASITNKEKILLIKQSKKFNAIPAFASIEIGSSDGERFNQGLALKNDGFYINYTGLKILSDDSPLS